MKFLLTIFLVITAIFAPSLAVAQDIPDAVAAQVAKNPDKFLDEMAVIITGFGKDSAIDKLGLQNVVAMQRADARAMAFRRLQGADLNGDGAIGGDEMRLKAAALAAQARGRLVLYFGKADMNGDNHVSADELLGYANSVALDSFDAQKAAAVLAVMAFDTNSDGRVTLPEVKAAVALSLFSKKGDAADSKQKI